MLAHLPSCAPVRLHGLLRRGLAICAPLADLCCALPGRELCSRNGAL